MVLCTHGKCFTEEKPQAGWSLLEIHIFKILHIYWFSFISYQCFAQNQAHYCSRVSYFCCIFSRLIQLLQNTMIDPILASPLHECCTILVYCTRIFFLLHEIHFSWYVIQLVSTEPPWNGSWGSIEERKLFTWRSAESLGSFIHTSIKIWKTSSTITELP